MADSLSPRSNVREHDDDLQCSERVSSAARPCNGERTSAAVVPFPRAVAAAAYTVGEAQRLAAEAAAEPVENMRPSR
jgi:hypothetical protein